MRIATHLLGVLSAGLSSAMLPVAGHAEMCAADTVTVTVDAIPSHLDAGDVPKLFDGDTSYSSDKDLRFHHPNTPGDNALILGMGASQGAGTTYTIYYTNEDADGKDAQDFADNLNAAGYGAWYWDLDSSGVLDGDDFDVNGDGDVDIGTGDYSPLGLVVWLYDGDPGDPVGSGPGTLVHTDYSPIRLIEITSYSFTGTAPAAFDHLVIESTPDDEGPDPRVVEIELNGIPNTGPIQFSAEACLAITKTPDTAGLSSPTAAGDIVPYALQVSNSGALAVTGITVTDTLGAPVCPTSGTNTIATLAGGASETCTFSYTITQADLDGNGGGDGDIDNTASAAGTSAGGPLSDNDSAEVALVISRDLSISKVANDTTNVGVGQVVTYTYTVTNSGNVTISNINLSDVHGGFGSPPVPGNETLFSDIAPIGDSTDGSVNGSWDVLGPGDQVRFTGQYTVVQADLDNLQ